MAMDGFMSAPLGRRLIRTLVDSSVGFPERLVFEGAPVVEPPLAQDIETRRATVTPGEAVDTRSAVQPLTDSGT